MILYPFNSFFFTISVISIELVALLLNAKEECLSGYRGILATVTNFIILLSAILNTLIINNKRQPPRYYDDYYNNINRRNQDIIDINSFITVLEIILSFIVFQIHSDNYNVLTLLPSIYIYITFISIIVGSYYNIKDAMYSKYVNIEAYVVLNITFVVICTSIFGIKEYEERGKMPIITNIAILFSSFTLLSCIDIAKTYRVQPNNYRYQEIVVLCASAIINILTIALSYHSFYTNLYNNLTPMYAAVLIWVHMTAFYTLIQCCCYLVKSINFIRKNYIMIICYPYTYMIKSQLDKLKHQQTKIRVDIINIRKNIETNIEDLTNLKKLSVKLENIADKENQKKFKHNKMIIYEKNIREKILCAICWVNNVDHVIVPCGHTICLDCKSKIYNCHLCNGNIEKTIKCYDL